MENWPTLEGLSLLRHIASESVAETFEARQEPLGRRVTVKVLRPNVLPSSPFAAALQREAQLLGELSHPNVQRLFEFHRDDAQMWLVMEAIDGLSLDSILKRAKRLSPLTCASIGVLAAAALAHCHDRGIVHRGVQPTNIILAPEGRLTLVNFVGAVKERLPTAPELLDGTAHLVVSPFLSPEQILGENTDGRSDLFSLGAVLYEALTERRPFEGPDERSVAQRIRRDVPPPPSRFVRGIPSVLERSLYRCLEKLPSDRFASADELRRVLETLLREHDISSPELRIAEELAPLLTGTPSTRSNLRKVSDSSGTSIGTVGRSLLGLGFCSALIAVGGAVVQRGIPADRAPVRRGSGHLELAPEHAGYLKVVADPWAKVTVDGQPLRTTPFAEPIPLSPGVHYVHLEHPRAPIERRTVRVASGETVLLDVAMKVTPSPEPPTPTRAPDAGTDAGWSP